MRNRIHALGVIVMVFFCCFPAYSKDGESGPSAKLVNEAIQAYGAEKALSCNSMVLDIDAVLSPQSAKVSNGQIVVKSNLFRLEYEIAPGNRYRMGYDGAQAWLIASATAKSPKKLDLLQVGLFQFYSLIFSPRWLGYLKAQARDLTFAGEETYRGTKTAVLRTNVETIGSVDFLIDAKNHLLKGVRFVFPAEGQPDYEIVYDSYFNQNGIKIPRTIDIFRDQQHYRQYKVRNARLCENVADTVFAPDIK